MPTEEGKHFTNQRLFDLVRHQRSELFQTGLIDEDEYAALVTENGSHGAVNRLENYDGVRAQLTATQQRVKQLELELQAVITNRDSQITDARESFRKEAVARIEPYQRRVEELEESLAACVEVESTMAETIGDLTSELQNIALALGCSVDGVGHEVRLVVEELARLKEW